MEKSPQKKFIRMGPMPRHRRKMTSLCEMDSANENWLCEEEGMKITSNKGK
jgi:hypothetical protein